MAKPKKANFELILPVKEDGEPTEPYTLLKEMRDKYHDELKEAEIGLAWRKKVKADVDGHMVLGYCMKVGELMREFSEYDFIIVLNREVWDDITFTRERKLALLDHELCHAAVNVDDETGETKRDERGRIQYRMRKHDIEEFESVVAHHGCYKRDLERFGETIIKANKNPMFAER